MARNSWFEVVILPFIVAIFWAVGTTSSPPDFNPSWSWLLPHKTRYMPATMIVAPITLKIVQKPKLDHSHTTFTISYIFPAIFFNQMKHISYNNWILCYSMNAPNFFSTVMLGITLFLQLLTWHIVIWVTFQTLIFSQCIIVMLGTTLINIVYCDWFIITFI